MAAFQRSWQRSSTRWWEGECEQLYQGTSNYTSSLPTHWLSRDSEEDGSSERLELSPGTLDSILDLTCAAPEFEGVLGTVERLPDPPKLTHRAVEVRILAPHQPLPLPSHQPHPLPSHQPHPLQPQLQPNEVRHSSDCTDQSYMTIVYPHTV